MWIRRCQKLNSQIETLYQLPPCFSLTFLFYFQSTFLKEPSEMLTAENITLARIFQTSPAHFQLSISLLYSFLSSFTPVKGKILYLHLSWKILLKCIFRSLQIRRHDPRLVQEQIHLPQNSLESKKLKGLETL